MSWASRRRAAYGSGVILFLLAVIGGPVAYSYFSEPSTCSDGKRNGGETSVDKGGTCLLLDERMLSPSTILWARAFRVRFDPATATYNAVAYVHNPNKTAGVRSVAYRFGLYDSNNVLVAEHKGRTFVMPGILTPVFAGGIPTGQRAVARTQFEFLEPLVWERLDDTSGKVRIVERTLNGQDTAPRLVALVQNTTVRELKDLTFIATLFDQGGNAFAASQATLATLAGSATEEIIFTWPAPFGITVASIDVSVLASPESPRTR